MTNRASPGASASASRAFHASLPIVLRLTWLGATGPGALAAPGPDPEAAFARLADYLRIDTINPPGNESRAVAFLAKIFDAEGITYETFEATPGRGASWRAFPAAISRRSCC